MKNANQTPSISRDLIEYLQRVFPVDTPELTTPEREIFYKIGQQSIVTKLEALYKHQSTRKIIK